MPGNEELKPFGKVGKGYAVVENEEWLKSGTVEQEVQYGTNGRPIRNRGAAAMAFSPASVISRASPPLHSPALPPSPALTPLNLVETGSLHVTSKKDKAPSPHSPAAIPEVQVPSVGAGLPKAKNTKRPKIQDSDSDSEGTPQAPSNSKPFNAKRAKVSAEPSAQSDVSNASIPAIVSPPVAGPPVAGPSTGAGTMDVDPPAAKPPAKKALGKGQARRTNAGSASQTTPAEKTTPKVKLNQPGPSKATSGTFQAPTAKVASQAPNSKASLIPQASTSKAPTSKAATPALRPNKPLQKPKAKLGPQPSANNLNTGNLGEMAALLGIPASQVPRPAPVLAPAPQVKEEPVKEESVEMSKEKSDQGVKKEETKKEDKDEKPAAPKRKPGLLAGLKMKKLDKADGGTPISDSGAPATFFQIPNRPYEASTDEIALRENAESFQRKRDRQAQEEKECRGMTLARFEEVERLRAEKRKEREKEDKRQGRGFNLMEPGCMGNKFWMQYRNAFSEKNQQLSETPVMPVLKQEVRESERGRNNGPFEKEDFEVPTPSFMARPGTPFAMSKNIATDIAVHIGYRFARGY